MSNKLKTQNILVILVELLIIIGVVAGITYALYNVNNRLILKTSKLGIDTEVYGDTYIDSSNITLVPIMDKEVANNFNNVLRINFNVFNNNLSLLHLNH